MFENIGKDLSAYAFAGRVVFGNLACSYLQCPPIFQEPINENVKKYWAEEENHQNCHAYVFGVVIKESGRKRLPISLLERAFYVNPFEKKKSATLSHTHAALMREPFDDLKDWQFDKNFNVEGVRHIFTHSSVTKGMLAIYDLDVIRTL